MLNIEIYILIKGRKSYGKYGVREEKIQSLLNNHLWSFLLLSCMSSYLAMIGGGRGCLGGRGRVGGKRALVREAEHQKVVM